ncbi:hypothetical protein LTS17_003656 [Exophiala oligosperma]
MSSATPDSGAEKAGRIMEVAQNDIEQLGRQSEEQQHNDNVAEGESVPDDEAVNAILTGKTLVECGCIPPTKDHLDNLKTWRDDMNNALRKLPAVDVQYKNVVVLMAYWEVSDVSHLRKHADELGAVFKDYNYKVETHILDNHPDSKKANVDIYNEFKDKLDEAIRIVSKQDESNLLILYYVGHGGTLDGKKPGDTAAPYVWQPTQSSPTHRLQFRQCQPILMNMRADVLFIFDCCYALAMIQEGEYEIWNQRSEILGASSALEEASAMRKSSFTAALAEELRKRARQSGQGANWYYTLLTSTEKTRHYKLVQAPLWRRYSGPSFRTGIFLQDMNWKSSPQTGATAAGADTDSGLGSSTASITSQARLWQDTINNLTDLSDVRVLIKIRLRNPAEQLLDADWMDMFEHRPSNIASIEVNVASKVVCHGIFESDSSILLVTVPIWLWQTVQHNTSYENLGVVHSDNLLAPGRAAGALEVATAFSPLVRAKQKQTTLDERRPSVAVPTRAIGITPADQALSKRGFQVEPAGMNPMAIERGRSEGDQINRTERRLERRELELMRRELDVSNREWKILEGTVLERKVEAVKGDLLKQRVEVDAGGEKLKELKNEVNVTATGMKELEGEVKAAQQKVMQQQMDMGLAEAKLKELKNEINSVKYEITRQQYYAELKLAEFQHEADVIEERVRYQQHKVNLARMVLRNDAAVAEVQVKELDHGVDVAKDKLKQHQVGLNLAEDKIRELEEREKLAEERKRRHEESVRLTERRLVERERAVAKRELLLRQTNGRNSKSMAVLSDTLTAVNDLVSSDPWLGRGWGKLVKNMPNSRFQDMVAKKTDMVGNREVRRILAGKGM